MLSLRETLYLPLDDLLYIARQYINAEVSRSGIARLLKRNGMSKLVDVIPKAEGETLPAKKTFKDYEPGFVHTSGRCGGQTIPKLDRVSLVGNEDVEDNLGRLLQTVRPT